VEEAVDDIEFTAAEHLVVHELADREVQDPEAERREHHRAVGGDLHLPRHHLGERPVDELP